MAQEKARGSDRKRLYGRGKGEMTDADSQWLTEGQVFGPFRPSRSDVGPIMCALVTVTVSWVFSIYELTAGVHRILVIMEFELFWVVAFGSLFLIMHLLQLPEIIESPLVSSLWTDVYQRTFCQAEIPLWRDHLLAWPSVFHIHQCWTITQKKKQKKKKKTLHSWSFLCFSCVSLHTSLDFFFVISFCYSVSDILSMMMIVFGSCDWRWEKKKIIIKRNFHFFFLGQKIMPFFYFVLFFSFSFFLVVFVYKISLECANFFSF